ncbi:hypothetical protein LSUE1_G005684 [Lachnellula suecica]|uniref:DUF7053 domain-containing protein n=1 Tax=Lachnellula suecica TaxID=602035 RepID=A0A8T9C9E2_9HELO|nr:hypothetical protein LSUE1_G005684 [Lachnellula suecica]
MPVFTTTAKFTHRFSLPTTATFSAAITILRDHDWLLRLDPELDSYTHLELPNEKPNAKTKTYRVTDNMAGIPKSIWDAKVNIDVQITDVDEGVDFLANAPMGVVQGAKWRIVKMEGGWQLVIETNITSSRLVIGIVKGKGEANAPMMGKAFIEALEVDVSTEP